MQGLDTPPPLIAHYPPMARTPRLPPFVIYLTPESKSVFQRAASLNYKSLSQHVRDLLARDVEMRAEQGEPRFAELLSELQASRAPQVASDNEEVSNA